MKKMILITVGIITAIIIVVSCNSKNQQQSAAVTISQDSLIKKGEYLVSVMGCHDCHTPKKMTEQGPVLDMEKMLSGHPANMPVAGFDTATTKNWVLFNMMNTAAVGPWGVSFSGNLTSDDTGIGNWTEAQFKKAITEGKFKGMDGTRPLLPPMPWQNLQNIKDEDVKAIFAFLKATKPVENIVPRAILPEDLAQLNK
ncbi:MAG: diheme cytochrome c-553 [Gloeobacteraceae cyanobacterium ES-bin-316]|nr:diheme cytochrome c-553 [Ferruginibacter sp.]